jgi:hypothetical protein
VDNAAAAGLASLVRSLSDTKKGWARVEVRDEMRDVERARTALYVELPLKKPDPGRRERGERTPMFELCTRYGAWVEGWFVRYRRRTIERVEYLENSKVDASMEAIGFGKSWEGG